MAEWSIAAVLKTVDLHGSGGSNPSLSARKIGNRWKMKRESQWFSLFVLQMFTRKPCKDAPCKVLGLRSNPSLSLPFRITQQSLSFPQGCPLQGFGITQESLSFYSSNPSLSIFLRFFLQYENCKKCKYGRKMRFCGT